MKFSMTTDELNQVSRIIDRLPDWFDRMETIMDLDVTHSNGCRLDLDALETCDQYTLLHDVMGIRKHLNRTTGELEDCFVPRCSLREVDK